MTVAIKTRGQSLNCRRVLNSRRELSCGIKQTHLSNLMQRMKNSGYNLKLRNKVLRAGIKGNNKILEEDKKGSKPLYRSKD